VTGYVLSAEAEADLRGIIRYTNNEWGPAQVRRYVATLEKGIDDLVAGRGSFHDMSELFPDLRMARCAQHYVFSLPRENAPALVVAIFHERMDLMTRLADRIR
tara:strand:- start:54 stop:362 length:309 start_codon:yes stop_codon:yes gene_type:complete